MNIYSKIKVFASGRIPGFVKILGLLGLLVAGRRMIGIFLDPVNGCNLRCRMCYMSDDEKRRTLVGRMSTEQLEAIKKALFPHALKLQIGCGSEPTLDTRLEQIIKEGKAAGIPYISLTTNGQLIASGYVNLESLCVAGLNELTLSLHGTDAKTYEYLMPGARFEFLKQLSSIIGRVKKRFPSFVLRVNFTVNSMNVENLADDSFWNLWEDYIPDVLQLRPVQNIGKSQWTDFSLDKIKEQYDATIGKMIAECRQRGVTVLAPTLEQLDEVATEQDATSAIIEDITYCYVSKDMCYKEDFDPSLENFLSYHKKKGTPGLLLSAIFSRRGRNKNQSKKLNYSVK